MGVYIRIIPKTYDDAKKMIIQGDSICIKLNEMFSWRNVPDRDALVDTFKVVHTSKTLVSSVEIYKTMSPSDLVFISAKQVNDREFSDYARIRKVARKLLTAYRISAKITREY